MAIEQWLGVPFGMTGLSPKLWWWMSASGIFGHLMEYVINWRKHNDGRNPQSILIVTPGRWFGGRPWWGKVRIDQWARTSRRQRQGLELFRAWCESEGIPLAVYVGSVTRKGVYQRQAMITELLAWLALAKFSRVFIDGASNDDRQRDIATLPIIEGEIVGEALPGVDEMATDKMREMGWCADHSFIKRYGLFDWPIQVQKAHGTRPATYAFIRARADKTMHNLNIYEANKFRAVVVWALRGARSARPIA